MLAIGPKELGAWSKDESILAVDKRTVAVDSNGEFHFHAPAALDASSLMIRKDTSAEDENLQGWKMALGWCKTSDIYTKCIEMDNPDEVRVKCEADPKCKGYDFGKPYKEGHLCATPQYNKAGAADGSAWKYFVKPDDWTHPPTSSPTAAPTLAPPTPSPTAAATTSTTKKNDDKKTAIKSAACRATDFLGRLALATLVALAWQF